MPDPTTTRPSTTVDLATLLPLLLTVPEFAAAVGCETNTVQRALDAGDLRGARVGRRTVIPREAVVPFAQWLMDTAS